MYTQGTLRRFLELFLCIAPSPSYSSLNSSTLCLRKHPSLSLQLSVSIVPCMGPCSLCCGLERGSRRKLKGVMGSVCVLIQELRSQFCSACCPLSENTHFMLLTAKRPVQLLHDDQKWKSVLSFMISLAEQDFNSVCIHIFL